MSEKKELKSRRCYECNKQFEMTAQEIKWHEVVCKRETAQFNSIAARYEAKS